MNTKEKIAFLKELHEARFTVKAALILEMVRDQPMYMSELADTLGSAPQTLNDTVRILERAGYVERVYEKWPTGTVGAPLTALVREV